jgi:hypothetical protein
MERVVKNFGKLWAGRFYGTNTGNVFLELTATEPELAGTLRLMDSEFGVAVYAVEGVVADKVTLRGKPVAAGDGVQLGDLSAEASLTSDGSLRGTWSTTIGTGGTLQLFPHDATGFGPRPTAGGIPEQLYTKAVELGAVRLFAEDVRGLLTHIREDFLAGRTVVTINSRGSQVSKYVDDFMQEMSGLGRLDYLKLFLQEPEAHGISRTVEIELNAYGQNTIRVQGIHESWVLGKAALLEAAVRQHQRALVTTYKKFGLNLNQVIFMAMLVAMPSIPAWQGRAIFVVAVFALLTGMLVLHSKFIPNAVIQLGDAKPSVIRRVWPTVASWLVAASSSLIAALIFYWLTKTSQ